MNTTAAPSSHPLDIERWLRSVGIWWDETLIQIRSGCSGCSGPALGVFAQQDIKENQLLCVIPRCAILSPRTTKLAPVLEAEKLGGGLALTVAVMYEASLGAASTWAGYLQFLPQCEYLPMFWTEQELELLKGTTLEGCADDDRRDTEEDYQTHVTTLMMRHPEMFPHLELCTLEHFRIAASWVASRSFHVDAWHGDAMIPLADTFNHKASLVLLDDAWKVAEELDGAEHQQDYSYTASKDLDCFSSGHDRGAGIAAGDPAADDDGDGLISDREHSAVDESGSDCGNEDDVEPSTDEQTADDDSDVTGDDSDVAGEPGTDDPQHGFAVGGMPVIAGGIVQKAGLSWVRDGVNLRLEIGICSLGPPDSNDLAAAAAAAAANSSHNHAHAHHDHEDRQQGGLGHIADHCEDQCSSECSHQSKRQRTEKLDPTQQQQQLQQQWPEKRLEIIAASPVPAHAEVHNTYGEHSNAELVHKYGFCLPQNPFDEVQLAPSWSWLLLEVGRLDHDRRFEEHIQWLQQHSYILAETHQEGEPDRPTDREESSGVPSIMPGGRLPLATAAVIRVLGATACQLRKWNSLGDVLQDVLRDRPEAANVTDLTGTVGTVVVPGGAVDEVAAEAALSEQFEDMLITTRDMSWWGCAGLHLLAAGIQERFKQYPALANTAVCNGNVQVRLEPQESQVSATAADTVVDGNLVHPSTEADQKILQECRQHQQLQPKLGVKIDDEHAAAIAAALQLRICEKFILEQAMDAISSVLKGL